MACVSKVKHAPKCGIWIWLGNLKKWKIRGIGRWKGELVYGRNYAGVGDGPFEVARGFAAYDARGSAASSMPRIRGGALDRRIISTWWKKLGDAEISLGRGCQKVVLRILKSEAMSLESGGDEGGETDEICV